MDYFVDTNIFLRYFVKESESAYRESESVFQKIEKGLVYAATSNLVFAEVEWTLRTYYKTTKEQRVLYLESAAATFGSNITDNVNTQCALRLYKAHSVKFADCLIASHPLLQSKKMKIVSYDKDFDKLNVNRLEPKNL